MLSKTFVSAALLAMAQATDDSKCYALIMSGGGALGAWEAGVYYGFTHSEVADQFHYDVISGVSAGAINTSAACQFAKGDDAACAEFLSDQWPTLTNDQIYVEWPTGIKDAILNKPSVYDDSPLPITMQRIISEGGLNEWKRPATFASVDIATGDYLTFDQSNITYDEIITAAKCSASIPGVFPPTYFKGKYMMDGGTVYNANIVSGISMCVELGFAEEDIVVDVYNCGNVDISVIDKEGHTRANWERDHYLRSSYGFETYLYDTMQQFPDVDYRYIVGVDFDYSGTSLLDFSPENTNVFQQHGREAAANALQVGAGVEAKRIYDKVEAQKYRKPSTVQ